MPRPPTRPRPDRHAGQLVLPLVAEPGLLVSHDDVSLPPAPVEPDSSPPPVVIFVRHRTARRYILRLEPDGSLRVTIPRGGSRHGALEFVERQRRWIERERRGSAELTPAGREWRDGTVILFRGAPVALSVDRTNGCTSVRFADQCVAITSPDGDLRVPVTRHFRHLAHRELVPWLARLAGEHDLCVTRTIIRNQRSLWGSCSPGGTISLNWRLLQMPPDVAEYVIVHELMHLREANHSTRFWRHVEEACPTYEQARRWLRRHGRGLW